MSFGSFLARQVKRGRFANTGRSGCTGVACHHLQPLSTTIVGNPYDEAVSRAGGVSPSYSISVNCSTSKSQPLKRDIYFVITGCDGDWFSDCKQECY